MRDYHYTFGQPVIYLARPDEKYTFLEKTDSGHLHLAHTTDASQDVMAEVENVLPCTPPSREGPMVPPPPGGYVDGNPKTAAGARKPRFDAIPPSALVALGAVMDLGRRKYGLFNWREFPITASTYLNAAERHLLEFRDGQTFDVESGVIQLGHVMACCAIVIDAMANGTVHDDRTEFAGAMTRLIEAISKGEPNAVCEPR